MLPRILVKKRPNIVIGALIQNVDTDSVAYDAGFEPGCILTKVNGHPLRDIIDWRWHASDDELTLDYIDLDGDTGSVTLERSFDEVWGFEFDGAIFDTIKTCKNSCKFCFMTQLPKGMRSSLSLRDDDYRLSFLDGTFVTLTNITDDDISRIAEQHISPLRVSLHAITPEIRKDLIGKNHEHGLVVLKRLLQIGITFDAQIVLCPGINDAEELNATLAWAYQYPGIEHIGIVPLGFTAHQNRFEASFDDQEASRCVLEQIERFQAKALAERGEPWVFAADEFYRNAYPDNLREHLPDADFYQGYPMFEDGIGIIRSSIDELEQALSDSRADCLAKLCQTRGVHLHLIAGQAMQPYATQIIEQSPLAGWFAIMTVENRYFGGNVNVTGLLTGEDIIAAINQRDNPANQMHALDDVILLPEVIFNTDGLTLDGKSYSDIEAACDKNGKKALIVPSNPLDCIDQLISEM